MTTEHPAERGGPEHDRFAAFSDRASNVTGSPLFYVLCVLLVLGTVVLHFLHPPLSWLIFAGDVMTAVNLLLLALLKNTERRDTHAVQRKLDAIAAALLEQREGTGHRAADELRQAIRMEENQ
ncbi:low affinity iron permease family protein [Streptomyces sp. NBC_00691]|uniref:low affinity iron permease family protein n=1 Tax=Streptomyces sp. NBC_00691 TaxID=2903671 RepID=UPI002E2F1BEB|nr:low affinity iron permease family protein [Streptomyces sp. NBC_00691]